MKLLEPLEAGNLYLKNRLVFPAFETNWATEDGHLTGEFVHLLKLVAQGGCGLIVVQCTNVNPDMEHRHTPFINSLHDDSYIPEYARALEEVKSLVPDVKMSVQLADKSIMGRHITARDLTLEEIKEIIEYFAQAARRAKEAGFDAVEFHAAHCYTLADFLSKLGNNRPADDPYGCTRAGRLRMQMEVIARTKELAGEIPIIYRFSGEEFIKGGNTLKDGFDTARALEEAGVTILSISAGGRRDEGPDGYSASRSVPRAWFEDACNVHIAERIKKHVSIPVITAGKIGTITLANQVLEEGRADLVAMARQQFCDPFTLQKTLAGRNDDILRCTWCRNCHLGYLSGGIALCKNETWRKMYMPEKFRQQLRTK